MASPAPGNPAPACPLGTFVLCNVLYAISRTFRSLASPLRAPVPPSSLPHGPLHSMFVPSAPSCSCSPSSPRVRRTYFVPHIPSQHPPSPFNFSFADQVVPDPSLALSLSLPALMFHLVPSCPYYCRSPTKIKRGFSATRESLTHSINHPLRHCACSIVISPTV